MSAKLTEEQSELANSLRRFFQDKAGPEYLRGRISQRISSDDHLRSALKELGLFEYIAESGAEGLWPVQELAVVAFEAGRVLFPENIVDELLYGPMLHAALLKSDEAPWAEKVGQDTLLAGNHRFTSAPPGIPIVAEEVKTVHSKSRVTCDIPFVPAAERAQWVIFPLASKGSSDLHVADLTNTKKVSLTPQSSIDLTFRYYSVRLDSVDCYPIPVTAAQHLLDCWRVLHAASLAGLCSRVVEMTVEYVTERKQFGVPVGSFQAVQHGLSDMHASSEAMRAMAFFSAWAASASRAQLPLSARSAILYASRKAAEIVETAIQLHGGIGFTWEHDLHLYLRRARLYPILLVNTQENESELVELAANSE